MGKEASALEESLPAVEDVRQALGLFDEVWEILFPQERRRILQLLISQVNVGFNGPDGSQGSLSVTYRPTGWKLLALELDEGKAQPSKEGQSPEPTFGVTYPIHFSKGRNGCKELVPHDICL